MSNKQHINPKKYAHLRAEALCAELISNGASFEKFVISRAGSFKKRFRKDIDSVAVMQDDYENELFEIVVNRDSLYDLLPEGLFHQPIASNKNATITEMVSDYRRLKEEEKNARKFFQPIEQEFTRYATLTEQKERELMLSLLQGSITESFEEFWNLPKDLPERSATMLTRIMPWAYLIKGNLQLTAKALQMILQKKIGSREKRVNEHLINNDGLCLYETSLGEDLVTGYCFSESSLCWIFTIEDILADEMELYTGNMPYAKLLQLFVEMFVPVQIDAIFEYEADTAEYAEAQKILGYGFLI